MKKTRQRKIKITHKDAFILVIWVAILLFANIYLLWRLNEYSENFKSFEKRIDTQLNLKNGFTFEDWVMLYESCQKKPWPKLKRIINLYKDKVTNEYKQTAFKDYLLEKLWEQSNDF